MKVKKNTEAATLAGVAAFANHFSGQLIGESNELILAQSVATETSQITSQHRCLCGGDFTPSNCHVLTASPVITVTRLCETCAVTFNTGSIAEKIALATFLLRRAECEVSQ